MTFSPSADRIQSLFNRIAPMYDRFNDRLSAGAHRVWKQMTVKWSGAEPGDTCLDVCCGSGDLALRLAEAVTPNGRVVGVDFSSAQLAVARQRSGCCYPPRTIDWVEGDALNLPFDDCAFDAVTMGYGLRNLMDISQGLQELHRVLKPGKSVAILDMHRPPSAVMRSFQQWYLDTIVVPTAEEFGLTEEYAYIGPSLDRFPVSSEQVHLARVAGFGRATHYPIAGGMMGVLVATKDRS
ncbi:bifunctional demethylmenaquinone methyltransferase/2-methoxy-6-polyprenyl-1,4-benzoquinol methylase UbiE [Oscillatoriales cyanobacterium LEGE 11467]|uniref:2-phytyl-1,4-naphtoquinone methyltransferase n=1 Tax=Zarconia navalis LEGE 11467 TaxID=1828826 RepID=A0A928VU33_9CYAN|nr:bifunctional demethylmenaquinone methyltransferase/2-methoxy-6-polyprenyl-1,4-benzoquinol methylase UbiE [Zarconia navalis]MBE9040369.1 bifunctional demethylmenaquinone methyltransferase/2-methoxy-6-polyprenyl-1,4-benzoquinol methylase UbiE [Zarconia navalis LEGE 11467]